MTMVSRGLFPLVIYILVAFRLYRTGGDEIGNVNDNDDDCVDESELREMVAYVGGKNVVFQAYVTPSIESLYRSGETYGSKPTNRRNKRPGRRSIKFFNISPETVRVYWQPDAAARKEPQFVLQLMPFASHGAMTSTGYTFLVTSKNDPSRVLTTCKTTAEQSSFCVHDPFKDVHLHQINANFTNTDLILFNRHRTNLQFAEQYRKVTGRDWLSFYPLPQWSSNTRYPIWPARYFGQEHNVTTTASHFIRSLPRQLASQRLSRDCTNVPNLTQYRNPTKPFNMTMKVLSVAPRVFEVDHFLSSAEIDHILGLATKSGLYQSRTGTGSKTANTKSHKYRSSQNSWISRGKSPIIDAIHRRAADLMGIDEAFLRARKGDEIPGLGHTKSNAEMLQLVHYGVGQEYRIHHDFTFPPITSKNQEARAMTLLLYLNEGMEGGETVFPLWLNGHSSKPLIVVPKKGKAVLFYNILPDGNFDDLSLHASLPVKSGEKWLINLWTWSPNKILRNERLNWIQDYGIDLLDWTETFYEAFDILADYGVDLGGLLYWLQGCFS